jgi:hypothetical protein
MDKMIDIQQLPVKISLRELTFKSEDGFTIVKIDYNLLCPNIERQVNDLGNVTRLLKGQVFSRNTVEIPLGAMNDGEDIYNLYTMIIEKLSVFVGDYIGLSDNKEDYRKKVKVLIEKDKKEWPDAKLREEAGMARPADMQEIQTPRTEYESSSGGDPVGI